ncbi:LUD domain-containing protein [Halobacteria archaeon AArc-curdl1]|uniref:LUD domain-containing protein n=1 Tax=Natronosalvus hydrolyticus TaxID=2979988 RepID=A0AAP2Z767_9EURY|nr:LUD domain-containing protein [Halobacteria archaeon AArc-curdl1]
MPTTNDHAIDELDHARDVQAIQRFREAAANAHVETTYVPVERATEAIADAIEGDAVGSTLPFETVTLPEKVRTDPTDDDLRTAQTGVTAAAFAIASYGTVAIPMTEHKEGPVSLFPPTQVAVVLARDVHPDMATAFEVLARLFDDGTKDVIFVTGPSSTGDMGSLVRGVHGPEAVSVIIVDTTGEGI